MSLASRSPNFSLSGYIRPILRSLGMAGQIINHFEFPNHAPVEHWEDGVLFCYYSVDNAAYRERSESLKVTEIRRFKEQTLSEHEYIVAQVAETPTSDWFVRTERFGEEVCSSDPPGQAQDGGSVLSQASHSSSASSSASSLALFKSLDARDMVTTLNAWPDAEKPRVRRPRSFINLKRKFIRGKKQSDATVEESKRRGKGDDSDDEAIKKDLLIERIRFTDVTLLDLVLLSKVVHDNSQKYQIFKRQCYWFVDMIVAVLQSISGVPPDFQDPSLATSHSREAVIQELDPKSGTCKNVKIYHRRQELILEIKKQFLERKAAVLQKIKEANKKMEDNKRAKARAEAAEAGKQAAEAAKAVAEGEARVLKAEVERRDIEERKRAEAAEEEARALKAEAAKREARIKELEAALLRMHAHAPTLQT